MAEKSVEWKVGHSVDMKAARLVGWKVVELVDRKVEWLVVL
jgi:hypothetical protein